MQAHHITVILIDDWEHVELGTNWTSWSNQHTPIARGFSPAQAHQEQLNRRLLKRWKKSATSKTRISKGRTSHTPPSATNPSSFHTLFTPTPVDNPSWSSPCIIDRIAECQPSLYSPPRTPSPRTPRRPLTASSFLHHVRLDWKRARQWRL